MDREYYNSLTEAYNLIERGPTGGVKDAPKKIGDLFSGIPRGRTAGTDRRSQAAAARREQQGNAAATTGGGSTTTGGGSTTTGGGSTTTGGGSTTTGGGSTTTMVTPVRPQPRPQPQPRPEPRVSGTAADGSTIRTSDVEARNAETARRAAEVRRHGGDPTAGGEFKTKVTDTGSARLNKALTGIGKWNEELEPLAQQFVENNMCDSIESARVILTHLDDEALQRLLS